MANDKAITHIALAARDFARTCSMYGYDGMVDLIVSGGTPDCMHIGGDLFTFIEGKWTLYGGAADD